MNTIWAPLAEIRISKRAARTLSRSTVERYRHWLEQGREAPPVRLARLGDGFVVRDGRHRVAAALEAGHTVIEAEVRPIGLFGQARLGRSLLVRMREAVRRRFPPIWGRGSDGRAPRLHRGGAGSTPAVSTQASVVSTASTHPLYG